MPPSSAEPAPTALHAQVLAVQQGDTQALAQVLRDRQADWDTVVGPLLPMGLGLSPPGTVLGAVLSQSNLDLRVKGLAMCQARWGHAHACWSDARVWEMALRSGDVQVVQQLVDGGGTLPPPLRVVQALVRSGHAPEALTDLMGWLDTQQPAWRDRSVMPSVLSDCLHATNAAWLPWCLAQGLNACGLDDTGQPHRHYSPLRQVLELWRSYGNTELVHEHAVVLLRAGASLDDLTQADGLSVREWAHRKHSARGEVMLPLLEQWAAEVLAHAVYGAIEAEAREAPPPRRPRL